MSKAQARIQIRVDQDIKEQSEEILDKIGISMSDLINMTLRRVVYERRIPFDTNIEPEIDYNDPNLPECMRIRTEEEMTSILKERAKNDDKAQYCTMDELRNQLNEKYHLEV